MNSCDEPSRALPVEPGAQPLAALIARVEAATGPDRDLDLAISQALKLPWSYIGEPPRGIECARLTSSLDAALALVERVLPGRQVQVNKVSAERAFAVVENNAPGDRFTRSDATTPALAVILALLRALQAQPNRHNARDGATPQSNDPSNAK